MVCENICTPPLRPTSWKCCFQSYNGLEYNFWEILNPEGHQNCITASRVTMIFLNKWFFPIGQSGEASRWRVSYQWGLPCLVLALSGVGLRYSLKLNAELAYTPSQKKFSNVLQIFLFKPYRIMNTISNIFSMKKIPPGWRVMNSSQMSLQIPKFGKY